MGPTVGENKTMRSLQTNEQLFSFVANEQSAILIQEIIDLSLSWRGRNGMVMPNGAPVSS